MGKEGLYSEWIDLLTQEGHGYKFNDDDDQATLVVHPEAAPAPGILVGRLKRTKTLVRLLRYRSCVGVGDAGVK